MIDLDKDWYTYLTEDFKLDRKHYRVKDKVVVDCPKCWKTHVIRITHLKTKIKKLGYYECKDCSIKKNLKNARSKFKEKYGIKNPGQLNKTREKNTRIKNGIKECTECGLKLPLSEFHKKLDKITSKCKKCRKKYYKSKLN